MGNTLPLNIGDLGVFIMVGVDWLAAATYLSRKLGEHNCKGWVGHQASRIRGRIFKKRRRIFRQLYAAVGVTTASLLAFDNEEAAHKQR